LQKARKKPGSPECLRSFLRSVASERNHGESFLLLFVGTKRRGKMKKILVFGTFDLLHAGHIHFFTQAKKLADHLTVVIATDQNVTRVKGRPPENGEQERLTEVAEVPVVDKVLLGREDMNFVQTIREEKPDLIGLGYDQTYTIPEIKQLLSDNDLSFIEVHRLKAFKPEKYKSSLMR
jgi:FAD synthetase